MEWNTMDILIPRLPKYVNQFLPSADAQSPSLMRSGTAAGAICLDFAYPDQYDPYKIEHDAYVKLVGPDTPQEKNGVSREDMQQFFDSYHIAVIDMNTLIDQCAGSDFEPLRAEMEAQNRQGVIQLIALSDESQLMNDENSQSLHPGLSFGSCIVRLGFSDDAGYALYYDPANPLACTDPVNHAYRPVKIAWDSVAKAKPSFCYGVMPAGVKAPPVGFRYQQGVWPEPKPVIDLKDMLNKLSAIASVGAQLSVIAGDLAKDLGALKPE